MVRCTRVFFFFSIFIILQNVRGHSGRFSPLWHQPNDFYLTGESCALQRPPLEVNCPPFGVRVDSQAEDATKKCTELGFPKCPSGKLLDSGECGETSTKKNPFSCINTNNIIYKPCYSPSTATIPHYYKGFNLQDQQAMEACAAKYDKISNVKTEVNLFPLSNRKENVREFPFPLIWDPQNPQSYGFLQCPTEPNPGYSFTSAFWITIYSVYGFCAVVIGIFSLYKFLFERHQRGLSSPAVLPVEEFDSAKHPWDDGDGVELERISSKNKGAKSKQRKLKAQGTMSTVANSSMETDKLCNQAGIEVIGEYEFLNGQQQAGYTDDKFGLLAYIMLWIMSAFWFFFLLLIVLDFYGMHIWTLCDNEAREACRRVREDNSVDYLTLRTGYSCASGCLFSWRWTSGFSTVWPYYNSYGGGRQLDAVFIVVWHLSLIWFIALKALQTRIRSFFRIRCPLEVATKVLISRPKEKEIFIEGEENSIVLNTAKLLDRFRDRYLGGNTVTVVCMVKKDADHCSYIDFQCLRYCWSDAARRFVRAKVNVGNTVEEIRRCAGGLTETEARRRLEIVGSNSLSVEVPSISRAVFLEFFDWFYMYQFFCLWVWMAFYYWTVGCVILAAVIISGLVKVYTRRKTQKQVQNLAQFYSELSVLRGGKWTILGSSLLVPGDVILVTRGDVLCDCVLLEGTCVADESSLTGEPTPVPKISLDSSTGVSRRYSASGDTLKYTLLAGSSIEATTPGRHGIVAAVVVSTGANTIKGQLIRDMISPPPLSFKFDQHWKLVFLILLVWGCIVFGAILRMLRGNLVGWYYGLSTVSQIMSPLIPAVFVASRANSARRLANDHNIHCVNFERILVCGKVKVFCFDKTGTLTKPGLNFHGVVPIDPSNQSFQTAIGPDRYGILRNAPDLILMALACTHELLIGPTPLGYSGPLSSHHINVVGNEVDRRMFAASGFELLMNDVDIQIKSDTMNLRITKRFEFDRSTMTMSCVVEDINDVDTRFVFVKGTFEAVIAKSKVSAIPENFAQRARDLSREGFYILAMAYKMYSGPDDVNHSVRAEVECDLNPLGIIVFSNDLKPEAPGIIKQLKEGSIRPVMITGDTALTAIKIARLCGLSTSPRIVLGDSDNDPESIIDWRDVDTGQSINPLQDCWRDLETGALEIALTGPAFDKLSHTPMSLITGRDPFMEEGMLFYTDNDSLYHSQLKALLRYTRIFARMKPDQKVQVIKLHMLNGVTGMVGDGANDAGALRMAHVGIALGNSEVVISKDGQRRYRTSKVSDATVVAPFSTPLSTLKCVPQIIKEGRCALATSLAGYKDLMIYGEVMVAISLVMYYYGVNLSEAYWITVDSFVNIGMAWAIMQAKPNKNLTVIRPSSKLLGSEVFASVLLQLVLNILFLSLAMVALFHQDFFVCREFDSNLVEQTQWWKKADNFEAVVIALLSFFQLINAAAIFNFGFDYRQSWQRNHWVVSFWMLGYILGSIALFVPPCYLTCLYRINCGDNTLMEQWSYLGKISGLGYIFSAPKGCPCSQQVGFDKLKADQWLCENEYLNCQEDNYSQTFHHNYLPYSFRGWFYFLILLNTCIGFFLEWFFIVGPVRRKLRARKIKLRTQAKLLSSEHEASAPFGTTFLDGPLHKRLRSPSVIIGSLEAAKGLPRDMNLRPKLQGIGIGGVGISGDNEWEGEISSSSCKSVERPSQRTADNFETQLQQVKPSNGKNETGHQVDSGNNTPPSIVGKPSNE